MMVRVTRPRVVAGLATAATVLAGAVLLGAGHRPTPRDTEAPPAAVPSTVAVPSAPVVPSGPGGPLPGVSPTSVPGSPAVPPSLRSPWVRSSSPPGRHVAPPDPSRGDQPDDPPVPSPSTPGSLLKRRDPVPEGVAEQVRFFLGGDGTCLGNEDITEPTIIGVWDGMERPFESDICFYDFDTSRPLLANLAGPGGLGKEIELAKERQYDTFHLLLPPPGLVPGRWLIEARQGDVYVAREFTVQRATEPRAWVERQFNGRTWEAGEDVHFSLGGFPAETLISMDLYKAEGPGYLTSFRVSVDGNGEVRGVIETASDDPPGCYGISHPLLYPADPEEVSFTVFCLERPG